MNYAELAALVREYTKTNSTTLPDATLTVYANAALDEFSAAIEEANPSLLELKSTPINLVAGQRNYDWPTGIVGKPKRVEAKLDGTNWKKLEEAGFNLLPDPLQETNIREFMAGKEPLFALVDGKVWLLSDSAIISVTAGLELWISLFIQKFTTTWTSTTDISVPGSSSVVALPRVLHELLARLISINYKTNRDRPLPLSAKERLYEQDREAAISKLRKNTPSFVASIPQDDGSQY